MSSDRTDALRRALQADPDNHTLRLLLAETLQSEGRLDEAAKEYDILLTSGNLPKESMVAAGMLAVKINKPEMASRCLEAARRAGVVEGLAELEQALNENLASLGVLGRSLMGPNEETSKFTMSNTFEESTRVTFADVGGLDDIKKIINRRIILPYQRPELYEKYGRRAGGAVMLYGPPGCGKTLLARAMAGECNLPFLNIRIEDVLSPWIGSSENNLHEAFEMARANAPCVLFLDELDAIAFARRKHAGNAGRPLVDQMLQELDGIGSENKDLLVLGATNAPWDVDDAMKRPGRFDRTIFVPPPDEDARSRILKLLFAQVPTASIDMKRLARSTPLFSGADLRALVEQAVDRVIDEALDTGQEPPVGMQHLEAVLAQMRPTTLEWLASARNYVEFANHAGHYDEVAVFLRSKEAKRYKDMEEKF
ncbi:MAG: AAA family ATPase [Armatimonadota bacterium]